MSSKKSPIIGLMGALASAGALAELPDQSILTRYGITPEQLPAAERGKPFDAPSYLPRFEIQTPKSWVSVGVDEAKRPDMTGNISIDRSTQLEYEHCLRMQERSLRRKGGKISCDEGGLALEMSLDPIR
ncbi:hypothetical protein [Pseudomonas sp. NFACC45]|uniref:hypothetical protein n=1 Tax=Pseudomonas sp. NFACC45 TaxID=1566201 RepID=UPI0008E9DB15|nr:hypothetical protein [Pseudomonas sp. NFACC45]SFG68372.1 hypothetical protein SAMN03159297_00868 [Pseudomonas sp. NFACC45]